MSKIEAVIFDVGGVLHESNSAETDGLVRELGLGQETIDKIWTNQIGLLSTGKIDETEFWRLVSRDHGVRQVEVSENLLGGAFEQALRPHYPILKLIKDLGATSIKLAVLSNTIEPHARALRLAGLYRGFDHLILSHEVGMRKPDPAIYEHALAVTGTKPEATIFVDDIPDNVRTAEALGMRGIVFTDTSEVVAAVRSLVFNEGQVRDSPFLDAANAV